MVSSAIRVPFASLIKDSSRRVRGGAKDAETLVALMLELSGAQFLSEDKPSITLSVLKLRASAARRARAAKKNKQNKNSACSAPPRALRECTSVSAANYFNSADSDTKQITDKVIENLEERPITLHVKKR
jgi:hypothetical protein